MAGIKISPKHLINADPLFSELHLPAGAIKFHHEQLLSRLRLLVKSSIARVDEGRPPGYLHDNPVQSLSIENATATLFSGSSADLSATHKILPAASLDGIRTNFREKRHEEICTGFCLKFWTQLQ